MELIKRPLEKQLRNDENVKVGDWYWVKIDTTDEDDYIIQADDLYCVNEIGSNYISFTHHGIRYSSHFRLSIQDFYDHCVYEPNWKEYFNNKSKQITKQIQQNIQILLADTSKLCLTQNIQQTGFDESLPAIFDSKHPKEYKNELMEFKENKAPEIQKEIKELSEQLGTIAKNVALTDLVKLGFVKDAIEKIEDRIFTIELYTGLQEEVKQIKSGDPAPINESIVIRQQLLYMDEETLFDYNEGGMDFEKIDDFDNWVSTPKNLSRIFPEQKGIVAFRVRRNKKDYGISKNLYEALIKFYKNQYNFETYLLIRNGENLYRIASGINFSPRLVPFRNEIGEKQFTVIKDVYTHDNPKDPFKTKKTVKKITKQSIKFDDHIKEQDILMKKYNRIFIFIQGLLDRSTIFHPHPGIKLSKEEYMIRYIKCIRDEEDGLPNKIVTWEEYKNQKNKSLKKGCKVWSKWIPKHIEEYEYNKYHRWTQWELEIKNRPNLCEVVGMKRDKTQVKIIWQTEYWKPGYWDYMGKWVDYEDKIRNRYLWVPIEEVFNLTAYQKDEYKMFLCDRSLNGNYLEWAPQLLTAENMIRKQQ